VIGATDHFDAIRRPARPESGDLIGATDQLRV